MSDPRQAIDAFWAWWPTVAEPIARAFSSGGPSAEVVAAVSAHVSAIHPSLVWEFGPGRKSQHHLCLSSEGDPTLRVLAERWLRLAPTPTATWEFHASRQPHGRSGIVLGIGGHEVALDELVIHVTEDETREKLDLRVHHPSFTTVRDRDLRVRIAFIALDTLLGEDDVERWIGAIELAEAPPADAIPLATLRARVEALAARATRDRWIILRGEKDGAPVFVSLNAALKRVDHLLLDTHVEITIPLASPTKDGLVTREESQVIGAMDEALVAALGDEGAYIGRETGFGKRVLHYHVMEGGRAASVLARWKAQHPSYAIEIAVAHDPLWEVLDRWR